jgi:hypothetical protein
MEQKYLSLLFKSLQKLDFLAHVGYEYLVEKVTVENVSHYEMSFHICSH